MFDLNYAALVLHSRTDGGSSEMPKATIQNKEGCQTVWIEMQFSICRLKANLFWCLAF